MKDNYYELLGVHPKASTKQIKKAYMALVTKEYFQSEKNERSSSPKLKKIQEAYEVLSDSKKRRDYDKKLNKKEETAISIHSPAEADPVERRSNDNQSGIDLDEKQSSSANSEKKKPVAAKIIAFVVIIILVSSYAFFVTDRNVYYSNRNNEINSLELIESRYDIDSPNEKVRATNRVLLTRSSDEPVTHYIKKNTVLEVLIETDGYYRLLTDQGKFWATKQYFEEYLSWNETKLTPIYSDFKSNSSNTQVISNEKVRLKRELNSSYTHYLSNNTVIEVLRESDNYYRLLTSQGKFWADKSRFKIYAQANTAPSSSSDSKGQAEEFIFEFGEILFDISGRVKPDLFANEIKEFKKGDEVLVVSEVQNSRYLKISHKGEYYYIMKRAISW